jgi:hypothetical protein
MPKIRTICIRGLGYFPSSGMANLAAELRNASSDIAATDDASGVFAFEFCGNLTQAAEAAHASGRLLNLNGHSFGGNEVCMILEALWAKGIRVPYAAPIDPAKEVTCIAYPSAMYVYNPYQLVDPVGRGIVTAAPGWKSVKTLKGSKTYPNLNNGDSVIIQYDYGDGIVMTIENERRDMAHVAIDDDGYIHQKIVRAVKAIALPSAP